MTGNERFGCEIKSALENLLLREQSRFPPGELLRIDLHCHDRNSDVTDEPLGRILRIPETWLPTADLLRTLRASRIDVITVTNHNNARTCWELLDQGVDVLVGAEFSCTLPDFEVGVHVLTYGFTPEQEPQLQRLRKNLYRFLEFTRMAGRTRNGNTPRKDHHDRSLGWRAFPAAACFSA